MEKASGMEEEVVVVGAVARTRRGLRGKEGLSRSEEIARAFLYKDDAVPTNVRQPIGKGFLSNSTI